MITTYECFGVLIPCLLGLGLVLWFHGGFRKPKISPNHARLLAKPGATLDLVNDNGTVVAKVVMRNITRDYMNGTSIEFVDYFKYAERTQLR